MIDDMSKETTRVLTVVAIFFAVLMSIFLYSNIFGMDPKVGDVVTMGHYGDEDIVWRVLYIEDNTALLISEKALDCVSYEVTDRKVSWEDCSLRTWTNSYFYDRAFSDEERERIIEAKLENHEKETFPTVDKVFILDKTEIERYMEKEKDREAKATKFAISQGVIAAEVNGIKDNTVWWVRSGDSEKMVPFVSVTGDYGKTIGEKLAVRPAMWINLEGGGLNVKKHIQR